MELWKRSEKVWKLFRKILKRVFFFDKKIQWNCWPVSRNWNTWVVLTGESLHTAAVTLNSSSWTHRAPRWNERINCRRLICPPPQLEPFSPRCPARMCPRRIWQLIRFWNNFFFQFSHFSTFVFSTHFQRFWRFFFVEIILISSKSTYYIKMIYKYFWRFRNIPTIWLPLDRSFDSTRKRDSTRLT